MADSSAYLPQVRRPRPVAVTHLPAGKRRWSKVDKIRSTRPTVYTQYYVGVPRANGDLTLVVRDKPGVLAFTYHAPRYR